MKNVAIIYWTGTGNTQAMAEGILEGAKNGNARVKLINVFDAKIEDVIIADAIAFGCPSMGAEQLEEAEMEPFIESIAGIMSGKKTILFGSYGWGDGEWMTNWQDRMEGYGANMLVDGFIINNDADKEGIRKCNEIGALLSKE